MEVLEPEADTRNYLRFSVETCFICTNNYITISLSVE